MKTICIAGAGTDIGKTYVAVALIRALRAKGVSVDVLKPVVSGIDDAALEISDPGRLLVALGRPVTTEELDDIAPLRFRAPLSPPLAASMEGHELTLQALVDICQQRIASSKADVLLIETAGGVMSPVDTTHTVLDLMQAIGAPVVLVGGSYLGAISHTLTALECLRHRSLKTAGLVVSESEGETPVFGTTLGALVRLIGGLPLFAAMRAETWDARALADQILKG